MKSFSLVAAFAFLAGTYAIDTTWTLAEGSPFEFHAEEDGRGEVLVGHLNEEGCIAPPIPKTFKSMSSLILTGEYCVFTWAEDMVCGPCASSSFQLETGLSVAGLHVMTFDPAAASARVYKGKCPEDNCPVTLSGQGGAPVNQVDYVYLEAASETQVQQAAAM